MGSEHRRAWADFQANLERLRYLAPVTTICMHGSPLSRINNLDFWQTHDYKALGIVGEPYLDVDFTRVFYLNDTGVQSAIRLRGAEAFTATALIGAQAMGLEVTQAIEDAHAKNKFLQAVLSFKLKVLSKTKELQNLFCAFNSSFRFFAVAS